VTLFSAFVSSARFLNYPRPRASLHSPPLSNNSSFLPFFSQRSDKRLFSCGPLPFISIWRSPIFPHYPLPGALVRKELFCVSLPPLHAFSRSSYPFIGEGENPFQSCRGLFVFSLCGRCRLLTPDYSFFFPFPSDFPAFTAENAWRIQPACSLTFLCRLEGPAFSGASFFTSPIDLGSFPCPCLSSKKILGLVLFFF